MHLSHFDVENVSFPTAIEIGEKAAFVFPMAAVVDAHTRDVLMEFKEMANVTHTEKSFDAMLQAAEKLLELTDSVLITYTRIYNYRD